MHNPEKSCVFLGYQLQLSLYPPHTGPGAEENSHAFVSVVLGSAPSPIIPGPSKDFQGRRGTPVVITL